MMCDRNGHEQRSEVSDFCEKYTKPENAKDFRDEDLIGSVSQKRKLECQSVLGMLNWLMHVAKCSDDPAVGLIPESSKWKGCGKQEFWAQILLAREALFIRRALPPNNCDNLEQDQQMKPRMDPSMYEDDLLLRGRKRPHCLIKTQPCSCCNSPERKVNIRQYKEAENALVRPVALNTNESPTDTNSPKFFEIPAEKQVPVGPTYQAHVPKWIDVVYESDVKWLGTRMWPPEQHKRKLDYGTYHPCKCPFANSVECVRFHIAEKRLKLKQELGLLFYRWRFDRMGEEVSLAWTKEEENIFKDLIRSYGALPKKFLNNCFRLLPNKTRENLLSYYHNVYLVQRRSYQNRVTPDDIDSDDDEKECGSVGDRFGYKALYIPGSSSLLCALNTQSVEFV